MEIIYKDYADDIITQTQASNNGRYKKFYLENGGVKKIEKYNNSILEYITYYISESENELDIVTQLTPLATVSITIITHKQPLNGYFTQREKDYRNGVLKNEGRVLLDGFNNLICVEDIDSNTGLPIGGTGTKYYYGTDPVIDDQEVFTAEFDQDGNLLEIFMPDIDPWLKGKAYDATDISELEARFPGNPDLSYYLTNTFEP